MTKYMDDTVRNLTDALKEKGRWEDTLMVFTTDNGGSPLSGFFILLPGAGS